MQLDDQGKPIEAAADHTLDKLAALGTTFNTNPGFGLMGMLEGQEQRAQQAAQAPATQDPAQAAPGTGEDDKAPEWFGPLNSSLQVFRNDVSEQIGTLRNEIQRVAQPSQPAMSQADYDALDPTIKNQMALDHRLAQVELNTHFERARNDLNRIKQEHPDFEYGEKELNDLFKNRIAGNLDAARASDFHAHYKQLYNEQLVPKVNARLKALEAENNQLKSGRSNVTEMSSVPRGNRQSVQPPAQQSGDAIDEDLYRRASARMSKGRFGGFNRALVEEQQRKSLSRAY
jgi:hypothetical protein